jgi:hypothetical protein
MVESGCRYDRATLWTVTARTAKNKNKNKNVGVVTEEDAREEDH